MLQVNGVKGIVFNVYEDGTHGQMMSVKAFRGKQNLYCVKSAYLKGVSMLDENDGKANTDELLPMHLQKESHLPTTQFIIGVSH